MHPLLLPGTHLLRRDAQHVQAGITPETSVVLPVAAAPAASAIASLGDEGSRFTSALVRAGVAVRDDRPLRSALPAETTVDPWHRHTIAAVARRTGDDFAVAASARAAHVVAVSAFGHPVGHQVAAALVTLLQRTGLRASPAARHGAPQPGSPDGAVLHVLVGVGEPSRALVDPWLQAGVPHLVVRLVEGCAVVGPLVAPGTSACLRCIDAYLTERDPCWPLLVEQYARASRRDRADGIPEPVDAALTAVAVGWAARDLATHAEGGVPPSWSSTVRLSADLAAVETTRWPPHPHCGCGWR